MNRSRLVTILTTALVTVLPGTVQAASDIPGRGTLPDNRGYELVSPADKHGGDVAADAGRVRASVSGDAVSFPSLTAFGDTLGTGISAEYLSRRISQPNSQGWQTHGIFPQLKPLSFKGAVLGKDTIYRGEFSDDLSKGVLNSYTPLTDDRAVATVSNLYRRSGLLSGGAGISALVSACPVCATTGPLTDPSPGATYLPMVADTTPDLEHVVFEATRNLTPDAPAYLPFPDGFCNDNPFVPFVGCAPRLYEWDHGILRLAGVLPDGSAAPISMAGTGATGRGYTLNTVSDDGSKIFFTVPSNPNEISGDLYMRLNHKTTVKLNASQRTDCAEHDPCTGTPEPDSGGAQPAFYEIASADGRRVFFRSAEQLTDAPGGNLYVYDTTLPISDPNHLRHVLVDRQPDDGATDSTGVIGVNDDGSYLYFLDQSALLTDQHALPSVASDGIYSWHNGTISFVGSFNAGGSNTVSNAWPGLGSRVTPDGQTLLFTAEKGDGLTGYDHGTTGCGSQKVEPCSGLYRYRADAGQLTCISCNPTGATATADASFTIRSGTGGTQSASHLNHPMSADGSRVFFETGERLLPGQDVNGAKSDVYEWTATGAEGCAPSSVGYTAVSGGCLSLITSGTSTDDSHFLDASPSGHDVFFSTNQRLNGWDTDNNYDLYDARVGGGFPDPSLSKAECTGEYCQGAPARSSEPPVVGGGSLSGTGNVSTKRSGKPATAKRPSSKPRYADSVRARRLKAALKTCKKMARGGARQRCEARAKKRYRTVTSTKKGK